MKKYNNIIITDTDGNTVFDGSYTKLLGKFNNTAYGKGISIIHSESCECKKRNEK